MSRRDNEQTLEERDPLAAIRALEEGIAERKSIIESHRKEIERHRRDVEHMHETLGMVRARNPGLVESGS